MSAPPADLELQLACADKTAAVFSSDILKIPALAQLYPFKRFIEKPSSSQAAEVDLVLTWGNKPSGRGARAFSAEHNKPLWRLEDGFFRSVRPGSEESPCSLILDDAGIYYDAHQPSRLEQLIASSQVDDPALLQRTRAALDFVRRHRLSKYNDGRSIQDEGNHPTLHDGRGWQKVMVVDQTAGDASIVGGLAAEESFRQMLAWALAEFPESEILVRTHPDVLDGRKQGYLPLGELNDPRVTLDTARTNPLDALATMDHVVTATSQLGFEALVMGKKVSCFGAPFYAGWGLTDDHVEVPRRSVARSLEQVAAAAWLLYPRYAHPARGERCELEDVLEHLALQRRRFAQNRGRILALGFHPWKRRATSAHLGGPETQIDFIRELTSESEVSGHDRVVAWGQKLSFDQEAKLRAAGHEVARVEDGFLRSPGLGSDLTPAASIVVDSRGIYFDPSRPSDLEHFLSTHEFNNEERVRGAALRRRVVDGRLSKYNVQEDAPATFDTGGRPIALVIGQVDDDASIVLGTSLVRSNQALLERVRQDRPDAYLIYKPHPDILSGNRKGASLAELAPHADHVETELAAVACIDAADEVHTLTSLMGFEALLRDKPVFTYGMPFYGGWSLTTDAATCERRTRRLSLDELVYGVLIAYPRYYSFTAGCFVEAEEALEELIEASAAQGRAKVRPSLLRKLRRFGKHLHGRFVDAPRLAKEERKRRE